MSSQWKDVIFKIRKFYACLSLCFASLTSNIPSTLTTYIPKDLLQYLEIFGLTLKVKKMLSGIKLLFL